jgi:hypothetical protein
MKSGIKTSSGESVFSGPSPRSRARQAAVIALNSALVVGTSATAGLWAIGSASATPPTPGWTTQQGPTPTGPNAPTGDGEITDESCVSAVFCAAVGSYEDSHTNTYNMLDVLNGTTWTSVEAPVPGPMDTSEPGTEMYSVSCLPDETCFAVGGYQTSDGQAAGFIDTYSSGQWTSAMAPDPAGISTTDPATYLKSVDCTLDGTCVAVGTYLDSDNTGVGLIETYTGGAWSAMAAPATSAAAATDVYMSTVSCWSAGDCGATAMYKDPAGYALETLQSTGGVWSAEGVTLPSDAADTDQDALFFKTSCSAGQCLAVGTYKQTGDKAAPLLAHYLDGSWTVSKGPVPSDASSPEQGYLKSPSCTADGSCSAVGVYVVGSEPKGLITTVNDTSTTSVSSPLPANAASADGAELDGISCVSADNCTAVGGYVPVGSAESPLQITETNGVWSATGPTLPSNADTGTSTTADFKAVSCTARGACDAGGSFTDTSHTEQPLLGTSTPSPGYWEVAGDGGIFSFGQAKFYGSMGGQTLNEPIVGMATVPGDGGYREVASDGGIFSFGTAKFFGSMGGQPLNEPIVGMAATPDGQGYWLVASDGGIFAFGDAKFFGSMGGQSLNKPIVGIAPTPSGQGYWEVASDGGIFAFGDAAFYGSMGGQALNEPIVGIAANVTGKGYWEVASDGGIFSFGDTQFFGSMGGQLLNKPIVGLMSTFDGQGYWELASDGGIFSFGDAGFQGSMGGTTLNSPVVNGAAT